MVDRPPRRVYSTGPEGTAEVPRCPDCRSTPCRCEPSIVLPPSAHAVRVRRERSGRRGKTVTVAGPFYLTRDEASRLVKELKRACGSGGTVKSATDAAGTPGLFLEIQGDHVNRVVEQLQGRGFPAKRAGGG